MVFILLRAFANGGASLTGIEAVSDAVGAFRPPEGRNARQVLMTEGAILGILVAGISWLAHDTHATPRTAGYPTVLAQEAQYVFGHTFIGQIMFYVVQGATMLILYTGGNTSFNGFPFLTSYVAGRLVPAPLAAQARAPAGFLQRHHPADRSASVALLIIKDADVNNLVPLYAIGVFTAFSMAGFGMARYHSRHRTRGWRRRLVINFSAGVLTSIVVLIFAVVKFTEGAWLVVVLFLVLVPALIRLNREYSDETEVLETISENQPPPPPHYSRRTVFVFVDSFDLATLAAMRYARSMRPTTIRAVHFVIDSVRADKLRDKWTRADRGMALDFIDVSDRRLTRAAAELVEREAADPSTHVTVVLPRRSYSALLGRLLHDRTADKIAAVVSRIPRSAATIVPYDVTSRVRVLQERHAAKAPRPRPRTATPPPSRRSRRGRSTWRPSTGRGRPESPGEPPATVRGQVKGREPGVPGGQRTAKPGAPDGQRTAEPGAPDGQRTAEPGIRIGRGGGRCASSRPEQGTASGTPQVTARSRQQRIGHARHRHAHRLAGPAGRAVVEGRIRVVEIKPVERNSVLACEISDNTGDLTALFYGRSHIPGLVCGARVRLRGAVGFRANGHPVMINPAYELLFPAL